MHTKPPEIIFYKSTEVPKGWGKEVLIANYLPLPDELFPTGLCGKLLVYDKPGAVSSMHSHYLKWEYFYIFNGKFLFRYINPYNAKIFFKELEPGEVVMIPPTNQHQVICVEPGIIIEFSTADRSWDNFRVFPGDSQKPKL